MIICIIGRRCKSQISLSWVANAVQNYDYGKRWSWSRADQGLKTECDRYNDDNEDAKYIFLQN